MLTKRQFDVLSCIVEDSTPQSQRKIANKIGLSVGTVNKILNELTETGLIDNNKATEKGIKELEPYKVKRAIIMAAGFGSRLMPITLNTPKPLVRVNGTRMIEILIDALIEKNITEIYVIRGYLGEQFDELLRKYPNLKFIENPNFNQGNNIYSIKYAKDYLSNAYVLEGDLLLYNKDLIKKYQYSSNYLGIPVTETDDWCVYVKDNYISKVAIGGKDCYKMVGITYWTEEDGKKLATDVENVLNSPGGKERYWDQVPLEYCKNNYKISVRVCKQEDIVEIDTFKELVEIDKSYSI